MTQEFLLPRRRHRVRPYLDMTALIDTVFNLLIFFAVASTLAGARSGMEVNLPRAETARPVPDRVVLTLLPGRPVQVNGTPVATDQIGPALNRVTRGNLDAQIVVMADQKVPYADLVAALDQMRLAQYHRIALAASPKHKSSAPPR
jgi:biopolymer transport protein TolR